MGGKVVGNLRIFGNRGAGNLGKVIFLDRTEVEKECGIYLTASLIFC